MAKRKIAPSRAKYQRERRKRGSGENNVARPDRMSEREWRLRAASADGAFGDNNELRVL